MTFALREETGDDKDRDSWDSQFTDGKTVA